MKIKLKLDDQETRAVWDAVQKAKTDVASWPAWKRGEEITSTAATAVSASKPVRGPLGGKLRKARHRVVPSMEDTEERL